MKTRMEVLKADRGHKCMNVEDERDALRVKVADLLPHRGEAERALIGKARAEDERDALRVEAYALRARVANLEDQVAGWKANANRRTKRILELEAEVHRPAPFSFEAERDPSVYAELAAKLLRDLRDRDRGLLGEVLRRMADEHRSGETK